VQAAESMQGRSIPQAVLQVRIFTPVYAPVFTQLNHSVSKILSEWQWVGSLLEGTVNAEFMSCW